MMRAFVRGVLPFTLVILALLAIALLPSVNWADDGTPEDLDGDQVADEIETDPTPVAPVPGSVTIVSGVDGSVLANISGVQAYDEFGHAVAAIGDVNGDGINDVLIGAPSKEQGEAYIFYGPPVRNGSNTFDASLADIVLSSPYDDDYAFGDAVAPLYDFDGDGLPDVRVRATVDVPSGETWFRTYVYSGVDGELLAASFGPWVDLLWDVLLGDLNNDGVVDASDIAELQSRFGMTGDLTVLDGDLNGDGIINTLDLLIAEDNLGRTLFDFVTESATICDYTYSSGNCVYCVVLNEDTPSGIWTLATCTLYINGGGGGGGGGGGAVPLPPDTGGTPGGPGNPGGDDEDPIEPQPCVILVPPGGEPAPGEPIYVCVGEEICIGVQQFASATDVIWNIEPSDCVSSASFSGGQICITFEEACSATLSVQEDGCSDELPIVAVDVDLDIDSDNTNGFDAPDRESEEDDIEDASDDALRPGKILLTNTGNVDDDDVPDFADGINIYGNEGEDASSRFTPLVLEVSAPADAELTVRFTYSASAPSAVELIEDEYGDAVYVPAEGHLRIWTKNGNESRMVASVSDGGDFVAPGVEYTMEELGGGEVISLFVEGIRGSTLPADQRIEVQAYLDGQPICEPDAVRVTVLPRVYLAYTNGDEVQLAGLHLKPVYTDGVSAEGQQYAGELSTDQLTLTTGSNGPHPEAASDPSRDLESLRMLVRTGDSAFFNLSEAPDLLLMDEDADDAYWNVVQGGVASAPVPDPGDWVDPNPGDLDPHGFEAQFEAILADKYDSAVPGIDWLEKEAWELCGVMYGGQSSEWFHARSVWQNDSLIYVEDSLTPEQAADAYYEYMKDSFGPNSFTPKTVFARLVDEMNKLHEELFFNGGDREEIGAYLGRHWGLVDMLTTDLETEVYTVGAGFVIGGVFDIARECRNVRFRTGAGMQSPAWPLWKRNWARGRWTEYATIEGSLLRSRNIGPGQQSFTHTVEGIGPVTFKPDGVYSTSFLEVKDWLSLDRVRQLRAMAGYAALPQVNKRFVLICTSRTKKVSGPLKALMKQGPPTDAPNATRHLLRRNVNQDTYEKWVFNNTDPQNITDLSGQWVPITKSEVQTLLGP